jgi:hypothetical protein
MNNPTTPINTYFHLKLVKLLIEKLESIVYSVHHLK